MPRARDSALASQPSKSRYSPIVDAISGKRDVRKTTENRWKIDPTAHLDSTERQVCVFSTFGRDLESIWLAPRWLGSLLGTLSAPRRILGASWASPGAPLGRSRGAPGALRGAPGIPLGRTGCPEVDIGCPEYLAGPIFGRFWHRLWRGIPRDFGLTFATGGQGLAATPKRKESLWLARRGCHGRSNQRWRLAQKNRLAYRRSEHRSYCHVVLLSYWTCLESSSIYINS